MQLSLTKPWIVRVRSCHQGDQLWQVPSELHKQVENNCSFFFYQDECLKRDAFKKKWWLCDDSVCVMSVCASYTLYVSHLLPSDWVRNTYNPSTLTGHTIPRICWHITQQNRVTLPTHPSEVYMCCESSKWNHCILHAGTIWQLKTVQWVHRGEEEEEGGIKRQ